MHVAFQLVDRRGFRTADDVERHRAVSVAAEAFDFEIWIAGVECVAERGRGLCGTLEAEHAQVPGFAGEAAGFLAGFGGPLGGGAHRCAVEVDVTITYIGATAVRSDRADCGCDR